ncbi:GIN domain-containing protein [Mucilaginibacter aquaedulcis]|uniref:GIN domain-containing protein n=1 Tax=Mucilaginibacter aquaedulcis TaxID=1187081 RepID=UPI0025B2C090|nr:DUF2807 domain-containing protein [Mucilaginibacter aquaedulcis]MDN3548364.1 DUF2807 domain-containing protein [Mucilaginibacter aquaedulcis]
MKTTILSFFAVVMMVIGLTKTTSASTFKDDNATVLNDISAINKVEVYGNVELYVSDATTDRVKVYNRYYSESALVQSKNGVLRISNYKAEKLVVWVSANDLRSISVFDNSSVSSFGKLSKITLNVDLHDQAAANLDLDTYAINLSVKDHAKVEVKGIAEELNLNRDIQSNVKNDQFAVAHLNENKAVMSAAINDELIGM